MQAAGVIASNDVPCQCCCEQTQWRASIYCYCVVGWRMQLLGYLLIRCKARGHSRLFHRTLHAFDLVVSSRRHRISQDRHPWPRSWPRRRLFSSLASIDLLSGWRMTLLEKEESVTRQTSLRNCSRKQIEYTHTKAHHRAQYWLSLNVCSCE